MMEKYIQALKEYALSHEKNYSDGESVLTILYEAYSEVNRMDDDQIKADFNALYQAMNGMTLREMDQVIYPVCALCCDHEKTGFVEGVKIGIRLRDGPGVKFCVSVFRQSQEWRWKTGRILA